MVRWRERIKCPMRHQDGLLINGPNRDGPLRRTDDGLANHLGVRDLLSTISVRSPVFVRCRDGPLCETAGRQRRGIVIWERDLAAVREKAKAEAPARDAQTDRNHIEIQGLLRDISFGLGYDVWIAADDRNRAYGRGKLSDGCAGDLRPFGGSAGIDAVRLIDVLWLDKQDGAIHAAFEVEHTTSIYSGIVRMLDLALGPCGNLLKGIFLVASDDREAEVRAQMARPAFTVAVVGLDVRYLPYGQLERHREAIIRFGEGLKAIRTISQGLP